MGRDPQVGDDGLIESNANCDLILMKKKLFCLLFGLQLTIIYLLFILINLLIIFSINQLVICSLKLLNIL